MKMISKNPKYLIFRDLIGLKVQVKRKDKKKSGFFPAGVVIDETSNTLITSKHEQSRDYNKSKKIYVKQNYIFRFDIERDSETITVEIDGNSILKRPDERIKRIKKIKWRK